MREIQKLEKALLKIEFDVAKSIYEAARSQGFGPLQSAALVYRHGFLDGKESQKIRTAEAYRKLHALEIGAETNLPEVKEGENFNEQ